MKKEWLKEAARDFIGLGGMPFLVLTITRVSVGPAYYCLQFVISSVLFLILKMIFKAELHAGIGVILLVFVSIFYNHALFTAFALLIYIGIVASLFYLKRDKKEIGKGVLLGSISTGIGYYIVRLIFRV